MIKIDFWEKIKIQKISIKKAAILITAIFKIVKNMVERLNAGDNIKTIESWYTENDSYSAQTALLPFWVTLYWYKKI